MIFTVKDGASVTIGLPDGAKEIVEVPVGASSSFFLAGELRVIHGLERKGIYITSDKPITVDCVVYSLNPLERMPDGIILRPVSESSPEFSWLTMTSALLTVTTRTKSILHCCCI